MKRISNFYLLVCSVLLLFWANATQGQPLKLDADYGNGGLVKINLFKGRISLGHAIITDSNGNSKIFGSSTNMAHYKRVSAVALKFNGHPDSSFGINGTRIYMRPDDTVYDAEVTNIVATADGGYLLGGWAVTTGGMVDAMILKLKSNGDPDSAWGNRGFCIEDLGGRDFAVSVVPFPNGSCIALCQIKGTVGYDSSGFLRIKPNGTVDKNYGNHGHVTVEFPKSLYLNKALYCDTAHFYAAGNDYNGGEHPILARFNLDGTPDSNFNFNGYAEFPGTTGALYNLKSADSGKVIACGYTYFGKKSDMVIYRMQPDGLPDFSFSPNGRKDIRIGLNIDYAVDVCLGDSGEMYVLGNSQASNGLYSTALTKLSYHGNFYSDFGNNGNWVSHVSNRDDAYTTINRDKYGRIYAGGSYAEYNTVFYFSMVRVGYNWPTHGHAVASENALIVYPNPAVGAIHIQIPQGMEGNTQIQICNLEGRILFEQKIEMPAGKELVINPELPAGMYVFTLRNNSQVYNHKIIVQGPK